MYGVVSLLDEATNEKIEAIWEDFQRGLGVHGVSQTPIPHVSYHVASKYNLSRLEENLDLLVQQITSFSIRTNGLGVFTGEQPVLYIPVIRENEFASVQRRMYEIANKLTRDGNDYYIPGNWTPHITLAHKDFDLKMLASAIYLLCARDFVWEIKIDNLAIIGGEDDPNKPHEVLTIFPFTR